MDFCLASQSEQRVRLLRGAGYQFSVKPAEILEKPAVGELPGEFAKRMAVEKAQAIVDQLGGGNRTAVLGADTDVSINGRILGKPANRDELTEMLMMLKSQVHHVYSAIALYACGRMQVDMVCTEVAFGDVSRSDAQSYWETGEPQGKAGGYAIQGLAARWIREIRGSFTGVIGLPLVETIELLQRNGISSETFS